MSDDRDGRAPDGHGQGGGPHDPDALRSLLSRHRTGEATTEEVLEVLQVAPFVDLGFARADTHRQLRKGFPEVIFGPGKTIPQIVELVDTLARDGAPVLVTKTDLAAYEAVRAGHPTAEFDEAGKTLAIGSAAETGSGTVLVVSAGTSDGPIAAEAATTSRFMGNRTERLTDVGVAGIHRLLSDVGRLRAARVIIVVAGMEGALPSVVAGLVPVPVIAVPTSVGYGASFGGIAALLGMLNSCGSGVTVVNIDNGFGAAYAASQINHLPAGPGLTEGSAER